MKTRAFGLSDTVRHCQVDLSHQRPAVNLHGLMSGKLPACTASIPSVCHVVASEHPGQHVVGLDPGKPAMRHGLMCWLCQQNTVLGVEQRLACQGAAAQTQNMLADEITGSSRLCHSGPAIMSLHKLAQHLLFFCLCCLCHAFSRQVWCFR